MADASVPAGPRRRTVLAALAPLAAGLAGCSAEDPARGPAAGPPQAEVKDTLIMLIRHAEKPYAGDTGEDEEGNDDPGSLAGRGHRRAEELPRLFAPDRGAVLPRPAAVFAPAGPVARSRQTVAGLAEALGLPVRAEIPAGKEAALARAALAAPAPVLICWEHTGIPRLIHALGADRVPSVPSGWPDRHDLVWLFTRRRGEWSFRELGQRLLPGDA
ncbi:phosphoglycerate mutase family protein [Streptomyces venezuelae]|nr:phosphoglycerate mutase family protein [Streptomyces venezuelae]